MINNIYFFAALSRSSQYNKNDSIIDEYESNFFNLYFLVKILLNKGIKPNIFFASSSLIFENSKDELVNEYSIRNPNTNYSKTKIIGEYFLDALREKGVNAYTGILFNHESIYRKDDFLFPKIIKSALACKYNKKKVILNLGDPQTKIDVGYAPEFINLIIKLIKSDKPDTYIISTKELISISEIVDCVKKNLDIQDLLIVNFDKSILKRKRRVIKGDNSKLESVLGIKPTIFKESLIKKLINDFKKI